MNIDIERYDHRKIERTIQEKWENDNRYFLTEDSDREKFYCLSMLPYPSGKIHMGHIRNYTIGDVIARYQTMLGKNVLQPLGWDAFGLPAENAALSSGNSPYEWTKNNIEEMKKDLMKMGFAIDWNREICTCDSEYYRWEQLLFVAMYERGLAYRKKSVVNWDPIDQTVLANEQVVDGKGWRSGAKIERKEMNQWFLKITDYAEELLCELENMKYGWPESALSMQRNWIGKSYGFEFDFQLEDSDRKILVYTTRLDTIMGITYIAISPEHELAIELAKDQNEIRCFIEDCKNMKVAESDIATMEKRGIESGKYVIHPISKERIPVWIANFVISEYGSGAVMCVPACDERDYEFSKKYNLPIKKVIETDIDTKEKAYTDYGILCNSGEFNGIESKEAIQKIGEKLERDRIGRFKTQYRLRDWGISRQRYWGCPIPIIHCEHCGIVPVPKEQLPVMLPTNVRLNSPSSPLKNMPSFIDTECPKCGIDSKRETDTFDTFMESSWYYMRYCCNDQEDSMIDQRVSYWLPVDQYIGGIEHAVMHLLYARFIHKVIRDIEKDRINGISLSDEPFKNLLTQGMVLKDGSKMSKSKGNIVSPNEIVDKYGADAVRLFTMFASPPESSLEWSDSGIEGAYRFLNKIWNFYQEKKDILNIYTEEVDSSIANREILEILKQANRDMKSMQFNTVISACMKLFNAIQQLENEIAIRFYFNMLIRILYPIAPHITEYIYTQIQQTHSIEEHWINKEISIIEDAMKNIIQYVNIVVQIDKKMRGTISVPMDSTKEYVIECIEKDNRLKKFLIGNLNKKVYFMSNKVISISIVI